MNRKSLTVLALIVLFGALGATNAVADSFVPVFTAPATVLPYGPNGAVDLGLVFTANSSLEVVGLGFYNLAASLQPESVGLYSSTGTLLASASVTTADPLVNNYFWASITPVELIAGQQYTVVAFDAVSSWGYGPVPTNGSEVTYVESTYLYTDGLEFTTSHFDGTPGYYGPNIAVAATPEPVTLILFGSGLVGIGGFVRRRLVG